jgi:hypothetical protein
LTRLLVSLRRRGRWSGFPRSEPVLKCPHGHFAEAVRAFPPSGKLPGTQYAVKGLGKRNGEKAIVYYIPNSKRPTEPDEKGFTSSELCHAHRQLLSSREFARSWFNSEIERAKFSGGAPCNFLAIGAVFVGLGLATKQRGLFIYKPQNTG